MSEQRHAFLLCFAVLLLYLACLTRTYYWDGVLFSLNIEAVYTGQASSAALIHPNHLLYSMLGYAVFAAVSDCGLHLRAITVLQVFNAVLSSGAAYVLYWIALRLTKSHSAALFSGLLFAFGATWWKFSTDADSYVVSVLLLLLAVWFLFRDRPLLLAVAICHSLAMLFHELAIFFYVPVVLSLAKKKAIAYVCGTGAAVALIYAVCYPGGSLSFFGWIISYASDSGFTQSPSQIFTSYLSSYTKLFVGGKLSFVRDYASVPVFLSLAIAVGMIVWAIRFFRSPEDLKESVEGRVRLTLWAWFVPSAIFLACWDPGSAFHKLFVWPPIVLLLGVYLKQYARGLSALAAAIAAWNFAAFIYPHSHTSADPVLALVQKIDRELPKKARIYYHAFGPDDWYLKYFAPGRTWQQLSDNLDNSASESAPVCYETTAMQRLGMTSKEFELRWELVNSQHNIEVGCMTTHPDFGRPGHSPQ